MIFLIFVAIVICLVIVAIIALLLLQLSRKKKSVEPVVRAESRESSWRLRWFMLSGDSTIKPFEWLVNRFPASVTVKIEELFNNKLHLYRNRITFESETDIAETESSLDMVNGEISSYVEPTKATQYRSNMNDLDNCIFNQYSHLSESKYQECNEDFSNCNLIINNLIEIV